MQPVEPQHAFSQQEAGTGKEIFKDELELAIGSVNSMDILAN